MPVATAACAAAALVALARRQDPRAEAAPAAQGACFTLVADFEAPRALAAARRLLAATWPAAMRLYRRPTTPPDAPYTIHLYRSVEGYERAEQQLTQGRFRRNLAFAHWGSRTAHVAVQPTRDPRAIERWGLGRQTLRLLVHEAAHLARYHACAGFAQHPQWFADGNASWLETEVLRDADLLHSPEEDPAFATAVVRGQRVLAESDRWQLTSLLAGQGRELPFYDRYAMSWLAVRFLRQPRTGAAFDAAIADLHGEHSAGGAGPTVLAAAFRQQLPAAEWNGLDARFVDFVASLRPRWRQDSRMLEQRAGTLLQQAFPGRDALAWRLGEDGALQAARGALRVYDTGARTAELRFGEPPAVAIFWVAADHTLTVAAGDVHRTTTLEEWRGDARTPFEVRADGERVTVAVHGETRVAVPHEGLLPRPWSIVARGGSLVLWHELDFLEATEGGPRTSRDQPVRRR